MRLTSVRTGRKVEVRTLLTLASEHRRNALHAVLLAVGARLLGRGETRVGRAGGTRVRRARRAACRERTVARGVELRHVRAAELTAADEADTSGDRRKRDGRRPTTGRGRRVEAAAIGDAAWQLCRGGAIAPSPLDSAGALPPRIP